MEMQLIDQLLVKAKFEHRMKISAFVLRFFRLRDLPLLWSLLGFCVFMIENNTESDIFSPPLFRSGTAEKRIRDIKCRPVA